jgi:parallel beta-helix repeat protein
MSTDYGKILNALPRPDLYDSWELVKRHMPVEQPPSAASYIVFQKGGQCYAKNGMTGHIEFGPGDASTVIQSAVNALATTGGTILIKNGLYIIKQQINVLYNNIQIWGESWNTILKRDASLDGSIIVVGKITAQQRVDNCVVANIQLDGNKAAGGISQAVYAKGVCFHSGSKNNWSNPELFGQNNIAYRVYAHDAASEGISFDYQISPRCIECLSENNGWFDIAFYFSKWGIMDGCITNGGQGGYNCDGLMESVVANCISLNHTSTDVFGFRAQTTVANFPVKDNIMVNCISKGDYYGCRWGASAITNVLAENNSIINSLFIDSLAYGIYLDRSSNMLITGCLFDNINKIGISIWGSQRIHVIGNYFRNTGVLTNNVYPCIHIHDITGEFSSIKNVIKDNVFFSDATNKPSNWVLEEANSDYNWIEGNRFEGSAGVAVVKAGANTVVRRNVGYVTENSGTATFSGNGSQTQFTIPHGLAGTPKSWRVEAGSADAKGDKYVTADATNLTVTFATAPPSGTGNVVLVWQAEM